MSSPMTQQQIDALLSVVRLGDADRLGWWRSHSLDEAGEYVLAHTFPNTWQATAVELAMESARIRHNMMLGRPKAVHLFSDYLPFHRELKAWLIRRKLDRDFSLLNRLARSSVDDLKVKLGTGFVGESRGDGIYMGDISRESLEDTVALQECLKLLTSAYAGLAGRFAAPYLDLV